MENIDASGSEPESWRRFSSKNREESQVTRTKRQKDKKTKRQKKKKKNRKSLTIIMLFRLLGLLRLRWVVSDIENLFCICPYRLTNTKSHRMNLVCIGMYQILYPVIQNTRKVRTDIESLLNSASSELVAHWNTTNQVNIQNTTKQ